MDYTLYLVTDAGLSRSRSLAEVVEAAIRGGVTMVQYREKAASTRRMLEEARELRQLCRAAGVPFIVNDRVDVALAVDADGVHLGQDDMPA
ncbi:MAG TPA: thiamine phosphate synthase, partial [bacterium]|nr:thiamine phosphate synthase [bacterium]